MNIPSYMQLICNLSGDILQSPSEISIKSIFELIQPLCLSTFQEKLQEIINNGNFLEVIKTKLIDNKDYAISLDLFETHKILFRIKDCNLNTKDDLFWSESIDKYDYYINRATKVINSTSDLIEDLFYKNRNDINDILIQLCITFNMQFSMLLFRNGCDHLVYCKDTLNGYEIIPMSNSIIKFEDEKFDENIIRNISGNFKTKRYKDTYMKYYCEDNISDSKAVYVLKLSFGPKEIGYLEFITHSNIQLAKTEIKLIQSLSNILAYVINNKYEHIEIENYIKDKFNFSK